MTDLSALHDDDLVVTDDGVDPVRDGEDGAVCEGLSNRRLYQEVGLKVDGGGGLIQEKNLVAPENKWLHWTKLTILIEQF